MTYVTQDIITWKYIWNDILSDVDFRNWIVNKNLRFFHIFKNNTIKEISSTSNNKENKGTFYMQFPGNHAHFVAYKNLKSKLVLFDPSYENGTYSGCLPDFLHTIQKKFNKTIHFDDKFETPQRHKNDSFCQTWTLCYLLDNKTSKSLLNHSIINSIDALYMICKYIISLPVFEEICTEQSEWINKNLRKNKAPKKWDSKYLLSYSRHFDREMFEYLFR